MKKTMLSICFIVLIFGIAQSENIIYESQNSNIDNELMLRILEKNFKVGEEFSVNLEIKDLSQFSGFQFSIWFNNNSLELIDIQDGVVKDSNIDLRWIDRGAILVEWENTGNVNQSDQTVFTLLFKAKESGKINRNIKVTSEFLLAEAYRINPVEVVNVQLQFYFPTPLEFFVEQNRPNPIKDYSEIQFGIPTPGLVEFFITNSSGKLIYEERQEYLEAGVYQKNIYSTILTNKGVYFFRFNFGEEFIIKKMLFLN